MNNDWINFLKTNNAAFIENSTLVFPESQQEKADSITALPHLAIIKITGNDASQFLQGQLTCDINDLTESISFYTAFCNAKGRTISTLLILKITDAFLLVLPTELIEKVINKLRMYVLRSDVQLKNVSDELCLLGLNTANPNLIPSLPDTDFAVTSESQIIIKFPSSSSRYLLISSVTQAKSVWIQLTENKNIPVYNSSLWIYQDISAGIPWLNQVTSEQYIPQMLTIDKLGGISFTKGCYTGQEIVARTHYLGKAKRELYVAECTRMAKLDDQTVVMTDNSEQAIGKILSFQANDQNCRLLLIIPTTDAGEKSLLLSNQNQDKISIYNEGKSHD